MQVTIHKESLFRRGRSFRLPGDGLAVREISASRDYDLIAGEKTRQNLSLAVCS